MNAGHGIFVAVEGPSGVGKSTVLAEVGEELGKLTDTSVHLTKQPSMSAIGLLIRKSTDEFSPLGLACLVAADRYEQLVSEIRPRLEEGAIVLCDRYLASSLVLQVLDGVDERFVRRINELAMAPDLYVFLKGDPVESRTRSYHRGPRDRFHSEIAADLESRRYVQVANDLHREGKRVAEISVVNKSVKTTARELIQVIQGL